MHNQKDKSIEKNTFALYVESGLCEWRNWSPVPEEGQFFYIIQNLPNIALDPCISQAERAAAEHSSGFTPQDSQPDSL